MTRIAGLPADVLDIVSSSTRGLLTELAEHDEQLRNAAPALIDFLYGLIPLLDDDVPLRRQVLAGKRAVGRLAPLPWNAQAHQRLAARATAQEFAQVEAWMDLAQHQMDLREALGRQLEADRTEMVERFRALMESDRFAESLALAAPDWMRHGKHRAASPKSIRTLYSYVSRTSAKTSPFSGLTAVGQAGAQGLGRAQSRVSAATAYVALEYIARTRETADLIEYRTAPVRPGGPQEPNGLMLQAELTAAAGAIWRQERVVEADHALTWISRLPERFTLSEFLRKMGGKQPFSRFLRLLDSGVIYPIAPWRQGQDPLLALETVAAYVPELAKVLSQVRRTGATAHHMDVQSRIDAVERIRRLTADWGARAGGQRELDTALLYEDRETELLLPNPCDSTEVHAGLESLGEQVRPYVFRSHVYDLIVDRFRDEFGPGGTCRDVLGFLMRLTVDRDSNPQFEAALASDASTRGKETNHRSRLPVGPTSAPPGTSVLFQVEELSEEPGSHRIVVNQFNPGSGGLFTRFSALLGEEFRAELTGHVERSWNGLQCLELVVWTDCNTAQAQCSGLLPSLMIPGEIEAENGTSLDDLVLKHDPATDTVSLYDVHGAPIGLVYLGLIPPHMLQSYVRLLAVLADPWINGSPHSDYTMSHSLYEHCSEDVKALPRISSGRLVTRRASWVVPVTRIPRPEPSRHREAEFAMRLDEFRRANNMPEELFVHQLTGAGSPLGADRKPMWVSLASPLSVEVLLHWLGSSTGHVRMVEALPQRHLQPQADLGGRRRVTEHAALLFWPREV
ncbi:hypothetical protein OG462_43590 [Streptomyces sp. NBC_01077]|uniref:hypothetical protein n=1 Tax=Streptomyces sp. NBC_01077 TaxID=2903746 RepID=UPI00386F93BF|nr:hypothetical protein OG462_01415 [Streptomyces sp. NBC_01077]WSV43650.1 hypothetical protein OG462_43590 [Streptomyces sp. NBC_01077]